MYRKEIENFLLPYCNRDKNASINYKEYEHSNLTRSISFNKMVEMIGNDIPEMEHFLDGYNIHGKENVLKFTFYIYRNHIVKFS